jgi:RNA polymerase sigma-70 factor (ECF subfamily)
MNRSAAQNLATSMTLSRRSSRSARTAGDSPAFEALFQQHWERLCRVLYSILGDWDEAEDLALETFVQLYSRPPAETQRLGGWLYRVASNRALNALRARKRRQHYEEQATAQALESNCPEDPAAAVEGALERQRVRDALDALKPRSAQLLILRHSGLSYTEIAGALDLSPASVGTLLSRAEVEFTQAYNRLSP